MQDRFEARRVIKEGQYALALHRLRHLTDSC